MYFEKKIYGLLNEADEYKAKSKETGKVVVFKSKDSYDAAVKGGSHEPLDKPGKGKAAPKGKSVFDPEKPTDEPSPDKTGELDKDKEAVSDAIDDTIEGIGDAVSRGLDYYDDQDVAQMIDKDLQWAFHKGADDDDILNMAKELDPAGREILRQALGNMGIEDINVTDVGDDLRPSDPDYKSPGERDTKGSDNPYDKGDEYDSTDYDSSFYSDVEDIDPDEGISDAIQGIRPEMRERAFELIIQGFDDDYDLKEMYKNLKNGKMPNPKQDSFGAIQHLILKQGIEEGSIDYGSDGMELANYLETREEDLYDQIMDPDQYDEIQEVKKLFKKRAGI